MGRRRESKDEAAAKALTGLAALGVLGWIFSPAIRALIILVFGVVVACLVVWICYRIIFRRGASPSGFDRPGDSSAIAGGLRMETVEKELTTSEKLRKIDWFQFEKLIEMIYRKCGCSVQRRGGARPDGGVDLILESADGKFIVQCKQWRSWLVGVSDIREFLGTLTDVQVSNGIFITLAGYTNDAKQLAKKHGIHLYDETDVIKLLEETRLLHSQELEAFLSDTRKFCPKCEREMVVRSGRFTGKQFWGCSAYPRCNRTLPFDAPDPARQSHRRHVGEPRY